MTTQTHKVKTPSALKADARKLFLSGFSPAEVAEQLNVNINTLYTWRRRGGWENYSGNERAYDATLRAYLRLIEQPPESLTPRILNLLERYAGLLATLAATGDRRKESA
ncbi:hypothetical protein [Rahnella sp. ChDrAdgB13]|uniref:terminase gpP N-terminus-related DNA-binding protein n=1 Tax=Rahnella sp. ChDrAdgB13 TaxID=1850581 RepID=UPI001AD8721A|nr:hypothetical protein [Rahnella sp. ChDrAdgB13]